ncbi:GGDEF domain-containing protein [Aeromonas sobria]|uniref:diguanylate cyclase n=1 Tax=Aeromonas sobria TaxID=646 RepID=A0A1S2CRK6_AERSO|nr:GGDEF domain-containing protein [Aeromonas sobria]MBS4687044.1 GGDEF domain-containing protein [Aeromonas sobria]OHY91265.1 hypothetical protein BJD16_04795 [Aeromonas sobria]
MTTIAGNPLYITWRYQLNDFMLYILSSTAFTWVVILYLFAMLLWRYIEPTFRKYVYTDNLTQLPRREMLNTISIQKYSFLCLVDIDNFKEINDRLGHDIGDKVLSSFASNLKGHFRKSDIAIRWGGEEFLVIIQGAMTQEQLDSLFIRILSCPLTLPEVNRPITFSGGLVRITAGVTLEKIVKDADELLYFIKKHGKNNVAMMVNNSIFTFLKTVSS